MRKAAILSAVLLALLIALPLSFDSAIRYHRRAQAEKLLATIRDLHPGITTETETITTLKPFNHWKEEAKDEISYGFDNNPVLVPAFIRNLPRLPIYPPWTRFAVTFRFYDGLLAEIQISEMQQDQPGYPHPNGASTRILSYRFIETRMDDQRPYSSNTRTTIGVDANGNRTSFACCHERSIILDERATPAQLSQSLNFQLQCLTSFTPCKDDRQILP